MFCEKCGKELIDGAKFCTGCGTEVKSIAPKMTAPASKMISPSEKTPDVIPSDNKTPKKKSKALVIVLIIAAVVIIALGFFAIISVVTNKVIKNQTQVTEDVEDDDETAAPAKKKHKEKMIDDPLKDYDDVGFIGEMRRDDSITRKLVTKLIEEKSVDPGMIQTVCCCDFGKEGEYSAFVFTGEFQGGDDEEYAENYYVGNLYYISEDTIKDLGQPQSECWYSRGECLDFGTRDYFLINEYYVTGLNTQLWTVRNGEPVEDDISRFGYILPRDNGDGYELIASLYDGSFDPELPGMLGHTWKAYYCDYSDDEDCFVEYGGIEIDVDDVESLCGRDLCTELAEDNKYILNAFVRGNNILNINYMDASEYGVDFGNISYDLTDKELMQVIDYGDGELQNSNYGGIYFESFTNAKQVLPKNVPSMKSKTVDIMITQNSNLIDLDSVQIIYGMTDEYRDAMPMAFIIDEDTKCGYADAAGMSAMEWMRHLANPTEDSIMMGETLMGVFEFEVTGSHVDKVIEQYWWD